ncbi:MAG: hypothetical protein WDW38_004999 [Sanguina aurantia]
MFLAGGTAGAVARSATAPLDRIKLLFQVQAVASSGTTPGAYTGVGQAATKILREEGFKAFWKGNGVNVVRVFPYASAQLSSNDLYKRLLADKDHELSVPRRLLAGACAGMTATAITHPLDTVRLRLALPKHPYSGAVNCVSSIVRHEGPMALYKGLSPTLIGVAPYAALNFATYDLIKKWLYRGEKPQSAVSNLLVGGCSGIVAATLCYPLDTVRRRMQVAGRPSATQPRLLSPQRPQLRVCKPLATQQLPGQQQQHRRAARLQASNSGAPSAEAIEVLRVENELLKQTIADTQSSIAELEAGLRKAGVDVPALANAHAALALTMNPEDYWSPSVQPSRAGALVEQYGAISNIPDHDGTDCFKWDDSLQSASAHFKYRWNTFKGVRNAIDADEGGLDKFTQGYKFMGLNRGELSGQPGLWYREWAPDAKALALIGEFNDWKPAAGHWARKNPYGVWELFLPDAVDGTPCVAHRSKIKCRLETADSHWVERIPAWIKWASQAWNEIQFNGVHWDPPRVGAPGEIASDATYTFKYPRPPRPRALRIYECHIGMSSAEPKVSSYLEFRRDMLPRIRKLGYNTIQIMAIQEHAYYGSFGYHVTNFFASSSRLPLVSPGKAYPQGGGRGGGRGGAYLLLCLALTTLSVAVLCCVHQSSSRFGTPDELKALIDEAHRLGLTVLMDLVHSHASKNTNDGINMFDGSDGQYFHSGARGNHWMWDSRLFNYGNWETMRFLLSNARWWVDEYKFDGYRFDGVTSMMYNHHGLSCTFTGNYDEYFGMATDVDAVVYLMLVNQTLHDLFPSVITVGEDVSGMPAFCRPWQEGGVGFDYRLQMAIADKWIELLKDKADSQWDMGDIVHTLTNRRYAEKCVGYAESHDQALVGDKTVAFWLMDKEMYDFMGVTGHGPASPVIDRGVALHKMIRLVTLALGGESYLNFMGNEFGHPEWVDFPRDDIYDSSTGALVPGNGGSMEKCRRRWDLCDAPFLRYKHMALFDAAMCHLDKAFGFASAPHQYVSRQDNRDKVIVVERGDLTMVFNFHASNSYTNYRVVLSSDEEVFGGWRNVSKDNEVEFTASNTPHDKRPYSFLVYAPSRTVVVYATSQWCDSQADRKPHGVLGLGVLDLGPYYEN